MLGDSTMVESSADEAKAAAAAAPNSGEILLEGSHETGMAGSNNSGGATEEDKARGNRVIDESDRSFGGNRWPRQETLALLKVRSDMDAVFRDSSLKGPLWEQVSRKLAELGYHRSAKKCKEKFENVYKYHNRTKDGRRGKSEGKTYRFFDQLEALQNLHSLNSMSPPKPQTPSPFCAAMPDWSGTSTNTNVPTLINVPQANAVTAKPTSINPTNNIISTQAALPLHSMNPYKDSNNKNNIQSSIINISSNLFSTSTSSSTASDEDLDHDQGSSNKKRRKWKEFFRRLTNEVIEKQEELQNKFLKTVERSEQERIAREEAWRVQEMAQIEREHETLVQERSTAVAKDAAVIAFLHKISGGEQHQQQPNSSSVLQVQVQQPQAENPQQLPPTAPPPQQPTLLQPQPPTTQAPLNFETMKMSNENSNNVVLSSPSRWPKAEVEALIKLRTNLDIKYQDNGPKGPLWEEISSGMKKLGYNRNSKRCKEKWENINKYFKKVKESNKVRPEDSKTCPYFHQLEAIYKEKISTKNEINNNNNIPSSVPLMVQPEQQWPPPRQDVIIQQQQVENVDDQINQEDEEDEEEEEENGDDTEEEY